MEVTFFKCAFIVLMGIAVLGVAGMVTALIVLGPRIARLRLKGTRKSS